MQKLNMEEINLVDGGGDGGSFSWSGLGYATAVGAAGGGLRGAAVGAGAYIGSRTTSYNQYGGRSAGQTYSHQGRANGGGMML